MKICTQEERKDPKGMKRNTDGKRREREKEKGKIEKERVSERN